jgi:hypothetical protein
MSLKQKLKAMYGNFYRNTLATIDFLVELIQIYWIIVVFLLMILILILLPEK